MSYQNGGATGQGHEKKMEKMNELSEIIPFIESLVICGPQYTKDVFEKVQAITENWYDEDYFQTTLDGIKEKFESEFYGFRFHHDKTFIKFMPKR